MTGAFEPCFRGIWASDFPYVLRMNGQTVTPQTVTWNSPEKVRQYTSNLYGSTPPICIAVLSWLLSFEERETLQYTSHLYCSTPPICTAVRPPFVRQYFWKNTGGWGHRNVSEHNERRVSKDQRLCFGESLRYDRQRKLVIRIVAITD